MHRSVFGTALRVAAAAAFTALVAGCAVAPPAVPRGTAALPGTAAAVSPRVPAAAAAYHGRFAVRYERYGETRNAYGNFDWQENGDAVTLRLLDPLGRTMAVIEASPAAATLELPNRAPRGAPDVETLMQDALGFALPVDGLRFWLQPMPAPSSAAHARTDPHTGRLAEIDQDGWTIDYLAYADAPAGAAAAVKRMDLTRAAPPLAIKLVLDP